MYTIEQIKSWGNKDGFYTNPDNGVQIKIGVYAKIGDSAKIGASATIGDYATIGANAKIGDYAKIGASATIGDYATIGDEVDSFDLNLIFINYYKNIGSQIYWKWVTADRMSPNFDGGTPISYNKGDVIEVPESEINDQQCSVGLHVLRPPYRPEWIGLCGLNHNLICLRVEVQPEDICYGGLPGADTKIRVRKLKVLD
jgi:hypothetical protein